MKNKLNRLLMMFALMFSFVGVVAAQDEMMKENKMMKEKSKPTVAIVHASWCPACKQLEPIMMKLQAEYKDRINFVILDVTDEEAIGKSASIAEKNNLTKFFEENKTKTSTVAVFDLKGEKLFQTKYNYERKDYVKAFDEAIAKAKDAMMK
jgi:thiol-disulfide isomerase/thioredoxin